MMKYRVNYLNGWQAIWDVRIKNQIKFAIVKPGAPIPAYPKNLPDWNSLTPKQKDLEDLRMSVYAEMVEKMDGGIGPIKALGANGQKGNTLIIFLRDNGTDSFSLLGNYFLKMGLLFDDANFNFQSGTGWTDASLSPYGLCKISHHGGRIIKDAITWGPGIFKQPNITNSSSLHTVELVPTVLDLVETKKNKTSFSESLSDESFLSLLNGKRSKRKTHPYFRYINN
jgi:arylsulfatase A-like enzyme